MSTLSDFHAQLHETTNLETWYHVLQHVYAPKAELTALPNNGHEISHAVYSMLVDADLDMRVSLADTELQDTLSKARQTPGMGDFLLARGDGTYPTAIQALGLFQSELEQAPELLALITPIRQQIYSLPTDATGDVPAARLRKGLLKALYPYFVKTYPHMSKDIRHRIGEVITLFTELREAALPSTVAKFAPHLTRVVQPLPIFDPAELTTAELKVIHAGQQDEIHTRDMLTGMLLDSPEQITEAHQDCKAADAVRKFYLPHTSQQNPDQLLNIDEPQSPT